GDGAAPAVGATAPAAPDLSQPPSFGDPTPAKPAAPQPDLSQPPSFN
ncbi:gamma-glutamyl-gamma-aminobutyrate hydrolase, partial [Mesorhizobium sp. M7A.F.Ca.CA.002.03.2.1]